MVDGHVVLDVNQRPWGCYQSVPGTVRSWKTIDRLGDPETVLIVIDPKSSDDLPALKAATQFVRTEAPKTLLHVASKFSGMSDIGRSSRYVRELEVCASLGPGDAITVSNLPCAMIHERVHSGWLEDCLVRNSKADIMAFLVGSRYAFVEMPKPLNEICKTPPTVRPDREDIFIHVSVGLGFNLEELSPLVDLFSECEKVMWCVSELPFFTEVEWVTVFRSMRRLSSTESVIRAAATC